MIQPNLPPLYFRMFGTCTVTFQEHSLNTTDNHSKKLWILLSYMVLYRNREISQNEFIDLLWKQNKISNPAGALKTLMHRLRKLLDSLNYPEPVIIPHHNTYSFNPAIPCCIDMEEFSRLCEESDRHTDPDELADILKQALGLYQGDFLPENQKNTWATSLSVQYHALYLHSVNTMTNLLLHQKSYAQAANLCWKALSYAPYEENIHYHLIHSLYLSGSTQAALTQYHASRELFLAKFSELPSKRFERLYKLITTGRNKLETDLDFIQEGLLQEQAEGTFFCEYEIFREIYRLNARIVKRTQASVYLCLITVTPSSLSKTSLTHSMAQMKNVILSSLRGCDIFSRYSESQYLLLIPAPKQKDIEEILARILSQYRLTNDLASVEYAVNLVEG